MILGTSSRKVVEQLWMPLDNLRARTEETTMPDFMQRARNLLPYLSEKEHARVAKTLAAICEEEREACEGRAVKAMRANPTRYETATLMLEAEADVRVAIRNSGQ
jgi:hypothetical protein